MPTVLELKTERAKIVTDYRKILDAAGERSLTGEETESIEKSEKGIEELDKRIALLEKRNALPVYDEDRSIEDVEDVKRRARPQSNDGAAQKLIRWHGETNDQFRNRERRSAQAYHDAFQSYILDGERGLQSFLGEKRAVSADIDFSGGYLVMPQKFVQQLIKFTDNLLWIRQLATKFTLPDAQSLGAPTLDTDPDDSDWSSELATGNEDSSMAFGKRELIPKPIAKRIKVSNKLLRMAAVSSTFSAYDAETGLGPIEKFIMSRLAYKTAVPQEKAFQLGNGINQPLGVFTASTRGISTARDVQTGSSTSITGDGLIATKYSLKQQYHKQSKWLFSRTAVKIIRQLKDSQNRYLWEPSLQAGTPDMLLDLPIMMSEYTPSTFTTGQYVGMLGDWSFYWIADSIAYQIQRLNELYAEANQTGFIVRAEVDGMPVLEEAFARMITN